jgi:NadR type nicotinamide-nucleotide adenylyltransferase
MAASISTVGSGLILGKFLPPHAGHEFLVRFARNFVDRLTVMVCSLSSDPIPGELRFGWMRELFPDVHLVHVTDPLPQEPHEDPRFWDVWREAALAAAGTTVDYVFASEDYGQRLAAELQAKFIRVDKARQQVPVSGRKIRERPMEYWEYLPECVRPYFVRRVCLFGPESTGKSTMARELAYHFHTVHVAEFAREWLDPRAGVCVLEDIPVIARGQLAAEEALARRANRVLFCDTDLLATTVWSEFLFGQCPQPVRDEAERRSYDLYLLLDIDVPWVDDSQRYLKDRRAEFLQKCRLALESRGRPFRLLSGSWQDRWEQACGAVEKLIERP